MSGEILERHNFCETHDEEFDSTLLTSGQHDFCVSCSDEILEAKMQALRVELADKGYEQYAEYRSAEVA